MKILCWLKGHNYDIVDSYTLGAGNLGKITVFRKKCTRCGKEIIYRDLSSTLTYDSIVDTFTSTKPKGEIIRPVDEDTVVVPRRGRPRKVQPKSLCTKDFCPITQA